MASAILVLLGTLNSTTIHAAAPDKTVSTEQQLRDAVSDAPTGSHIVPYIIEISANIALAENTTLTIPAGKNITLTGAYNLIGALGQSTITVDGTLTIDGITVTHAMTTNGRGITVNADGKLYMTSGEISGNRTYGNNTPSIPDPRTFGGGVHVNGGTFTMSGGNISNNNATRYGGGVYINDGIFILLGGEISDNTSNERGGGVYSNNSIFEMSGGEISNNITSFIGGGVVNEGNESIFTMKGGTIQGNTTNGTTGNGGGGIYNGYMSTLNMYDGKIFNNRTSVAGGGILNNGGVLNMFDNAVVCGNISNSGGGVASTGANSAFKLVGSTVTGNLANYQGGGICISEGTFDMYGGVISDNFAQYGGGAFGGHSTAFNLSGDVIISGNTAGESGGGIYCLVCNFAMSGGVISENFALYDGGGVYVAGSSNISGNAVISDNTAGKFGGGVYVTGSSNISGNVIISSNTAGESGGGMFIFGRDIFMTSGTISGNIAIHGGGIYNSSGQANISGGIISDNIAIYGGGIYNSYGAANMSGGVVSDNIAVYCGGGIYVYNSFLTMSDTAVILGNSAIYGGGIFSDSARKSYIRINGGTISNNNAYNGGGIWVSHDELFALTVALGARFVNNSANMAYDFVDHLAQSAYDLGILCTDWTMPFSHGYNNYDIGYDTNTQFTFKISYDANGGIGTMPDDVAILGKDFILSPNGFLYDGYIFVGWDAFVLGSSTYFYYDQSTFIAWRIINDITFYAHWIPITYDIVFDQNTSDNVTWITQTAKNVVFDSLYGGLAILTRPGYNFSGWFLSPDCSGDEVTATTIMTTAGDHTLYAKWTPSHTISYIVRYYLAGTTKSVAPAKTVAGQAIGDIIAEDAITIVGYSVIAPATIVKDLMISGNEFIFYYKPDSYTVIINDSYADTTGSGVYTPNTVVTIHSGSREGYVFNRWIVSDGITLNYSYNATTTFTMPESDVTITANWVQRTPITIAWQFVALITGFLGIAAFSLADNMQNPLMYIFLPTARAIILILGIMSALLITKHKKLKVDRVRHKPS